MLAAQPGMNAHFVGCDPYSTVTKDPPGLNPGFVIHKLCDLR